MTLDLETLRLIYSKLGDEVSKELYKRRLLYSLFGDPEEIMEFVRITARKEFGERKICLYGAGEGGKWAARYVTTFIIDKYKRGSLGELPILSLEDFLRLPDCREYLILITVGKPDLNREIKAELDSLGLQYRNALHCGQYFDLPQLRLQNEYFVDVGAFDGCTTQALLDRCPGSRAYVFEPNPAQFAVTKERLSSLSGIELFPYGAYDRNGFLRFDPRGDDPGAAKITEDGPLAVEVCRLDDELAGRKVTFIKMDIEGAELAALRGAARIIREQRPKLAICVYHKPEDMWEIPSFILELCPDYSLYLRHYSPNECETVLYAIP